MKEYYVISVKHTWRGDRYITVWGPDDRGYRLRLNKAGRYSEDRVRAHLGYYNSGHSDIAVPVEVCERLHAIGDERDFDGADPAVGAPRVLLNIADVWSTLILHAIEPPPYKVQPQYPGARRRKGAA